MPLVSVVMPSLNQREFIEEAINSVLVQGYPEVELIIADGGSTDGTLDLLRGRCKVDPLLRWFSRKDSGPAEAINNALAEVRGTIIGWLNSDDLYTPGAIERAVALLESKSNYIMVYGHGQHVDEQGAVLGRYPTQLPTVSTKTFVDGCFICQPTVFFKRSMLMMLGKLDQDLKAAFDFDYWVRAFLAFPERIGFVDAVQASSRLHESCITMRMRHRIAVEGMKVVARHFGMAPSHWLITYFEELLAQEPEERGIEDLRMHFKKVVEQVADTLNPSEIETILAQIETDPRLGE